MPSQGNIDQIARARAAVARILMCRAIDRRHRLIDAVGWLGLAAPAIALGGAMVAMIALGYEPREFGESALAVSLLLICLASLVVTAMVAMFAVATASLTFLLMAPVMVPLGLYSLFVGVRDHLSGRGAIQLLRRDGIVPPAWTRGSKVRLRQLERLAEEDSELVMDDRGLRPRDAPAAPTEACPRCGAGMRVPGAGIRRCDHCDLERFFELPGCSQAYEQAHKVITQMREGRVEIMTRRELWRYLRRSSPELASASRWLRIFASVYLGAAVAADLGALTGSPVALAVPLLVLVLALLPLLWALYSYSSVRARLRWKELGPGARNYDKHMHREIVRAVAHQGRLPIDELAAHLKVSRRALDRSLTSLKRRGHAPMYVDHDRQELVSIHARDASDQACPGCGAALAVAPRAGLVCTHCAADFLGGV